MRRGMLSLALLLAAFALAAAGAAVAEVGPPAPGGDGVWRANSNWTVQAGDDVLYENVTIEVVGSLAVQGGATLTLSNVSISFAAGGAAPGRVTVEEAGLLVMHNVSARFNGTADTVEVQGSVAASRCDIGFSSTAATAAAIHLVHGNLSLTDCWIAADAAVALSANGSQVETLDCDFVTAAGMGADLKFGSAGSYVLDTTRFGALIAEGSPHVTLFSTVRFLLRTPGGNATDGLVNGTGPGAEIFHVEVNASGTSGAVRLLWLDLTPAPARLDASQRTSRAPLRFTAVGSVGGNTSEVLLALHRVNVTVALDRVFDLAVALVRVVGHAAEGSFLREAYYLDLNTTFSMRVIVRNEGAGPSPPVNLTVTQLALEPSSFAVLSNRPRPSLAVPALAKGESVDLTMAAAADDYGGKSERATACYYSLSYTSGYLVQWLDPDDLDFGPWNDAHQLVTVAFLVRGNETAPCAASGGLPIELIAAIGLGAIAAVAALTYLASTGREERRAANRPPTAGAPPADEPREPPKG